MSPTPVTFSSPTAPAAYAWEATDEEVARRYDLPIERIVRFDLNTSPTPPALAADLLAAGTFDTPLSEYPPSDYRRLIEAAAARYGVGTDELVVGAGADEILDIVGKVLLTPGGAAIVPTPSYAMYRVLTEQRGARLVGVPRQGAEAGYAIDVEAVRAAVRAEAAALVWLCNPNNPTARLEPEGAIEALLEGLSADATPAGTTPPSVVLDEAYAEFAGRSLAELRHRYADLVIVRTASKAYALAGLRVGFAIARPALVDRMNPIRPPASISTVSAAIVTAALLDPAAATGNVERVTTERDRLRTELTGLGWSVGPSVTNFLLVDFASAERAAAVAEALLRRGLVPRTFPSTHPLHDHLRLTVRAADENDRLLAAVREIEA